jgi:hypothetical protein
MVEECNTGDIGYVAETGHFHPNKPPGASLLTIGKRATGVALQPAT